MAATSRRRSLSSAGTAHCGPEHKWSGPCAGGSRGARRQRACNLAAVEIQSSMALDHVHHVLQAAFGWEDAHLHRFAPYDPFAPLRPVNGEIPEVLQWLPAKESEEPGDRLEVVSRRPASGDAPPARLIDGARRGPLEGSGGFPGYEEIMDALADPSHPESSHWAAPQPWKPSLPDFGPSALSSSSGKYALTAPTASPLSARVARTCVRTRGERDLASIYS